MTTNSYTGMQKYEGLESVRRLPAMYVGSTGVVSANKAPKALIQLAQEVVSNSLDEHVAGYGNEITIEVFENNSMKITDQGRGLPKGPDTSFEDAYDSATHLHASGKFGENYGGMGIAGMHGIGLKAANALSEYLQIKAISHATSIKNGEKVLTGGLVEYEMRLKQTEILSQTIIREIPANDLEKIAPTRYVVKSTGEEIQTGTSIEFLPDAGPVAADDPSPMLESIVWTNKELMSRFESSAFLCPGVKITYIDNRHKEIDNETNEEKIFSREWKYDDGLKDCVELMASDLTLLEGMKETFYVDGSIALEEHTFQLRLALTYVDDITSIVSSFANGVPTRDNGTHVDGFNAALTKAVNEFAVSQKMTKTTYKNSDISEGLIAAFEIKVPAKIIQFDGQTKEKLETALAQKATYEITYEALTKWLFDNVEIGKEIISKINESRSAREAAEKARSESKQNRKQSKSEKLLVSSKLKRATSKNPAEKEMIITEGDSASNIGRDPKTQAVLPLRGKIRNVYELSFAEALKNLEVSTILSCIGAGVGPDCDASQAEYYKIIIACDADPDGAHIRTLLLGLFYRLAKPLLEAGYIYSAIVPLYKATKYVKGKPEIRMFYSEDEIDAHRHELNGYEINRYKGLGEMDPKTEASNALTNRKTRRLAQISLGEAAEAHKILQTMLGGDAKKRYDWIVENIDFSKPID